MLERAAGLFSAPKTVKTARDLKHEEATRQGLLRFFLVIAVLEWPLQQKCCWFCIEGVGGRVFHLL